jgi:PAS domain S-box-containing protein
VQRQTTRASKDDGEADRVSLLLQRITTAWRSLPGLRGGIGPRLLVRVFLFSLLITLLLTLMQLYLAYRRDVGAIDQRMSEIDSGYRQSLGEGLWRLDARQLQLQVEGILRLPDIRYVELREATDRAAPLVVRAGSRQPNPPERREFRIYFTNHGAEQLVGILVVEATFDRIYRRLFDTAAVILIGQAIVTFIVSFFILLIVHRLITRHLTAVAASLRAYDLHGSQAPLRLERRQPRSVDELDRVVEAFNDMYARLQDVHGDLAEREAKIRRLVDSNIIGIFVWDFDGRILEANDEFLRMVNYDREDLASDLIRWVDLTPPDWRDANNARIEQQKGGGRFEPFEKEFTRKDGGRVPILIGGATFEEGGNQGVAFVLDLTARKQAERALRERETQLAEARRELRQMIDTIPIPVASYSADAKRDFVNAAWKHYTGLSDEAARGTEWSVVAHPEDTAGGHKMWRHALATGEPWHTEERVRRADGQYRWFAIDRVAARDENGKIIKWYGTAYDIEDRKRAEERLRVQHTAAQILAEAATIEEAAPRILSAMGKCLGWDVGVLWRVDREAEALQCVELWHEASMEVPEFERLSREFTFVPGLGLPGRVWSSLEPEYIPDVVPDENFPRGPIAEREGLHAAFAFPLLLGGEVLGVIEFFSREISKPDQELLNTLATIGSQIGQFIERKRAENAVRESERDLRSAIDGIAGLVAIMAPNGELDALNRQVVDYFGRPLEEMKNWGTSDAVHAEDLPRIAEVFQRSIATGTPFQYEVRLRRFDGEYRWFDNRCVPIREKSGRIVRWYMLGTDIEDRKRAEQALRRSEAHLAEAQKLSHTGAVAYNGTTILFASEETYHIWGFDPAQGLPSREVVFQRIHPGDRDWLNAEVRRAVGEKRRFSIAYRILLPDGTVKHLETIGQPLFSASGKLMEIFATQTDVTERKRAEEALRESEAKFRDYAESASDWFWETDPDHKFTRLTEDERLLAGGFATVSRIGVHRWEFATDVQSEPEKWELHRSMLEARQPFRDFVYRAIRADESVVYNKISGKPVFDTNGEFRGYRGTGADVTAIIGAEASLRTSEQRYREAQLELAHANRVATMGQLTASITHEVNQPITAAVTYALAARRFLSAEPPNFREVDDALSLIVKEGNRAGEVVGRIRALIRKAPVRKDAVPINEAILEIIALTRTEAANSSVSVRTQLAEGLPRVQGDRVQLQQVLLNLIINAIEAMRDVGEKQRELLISTRHEPDGVSVEVRDSGSGFAPADLDRVFEPFYSTKPNGVGLGLSICRSIIEAHNGRMWASPNVPRGAIFGFIAPIRSAASS